jgi:hypothetical protein
MAPSSVPPAEGNGNRRASSNGGDINDFLGNPLPPLKVDLSGEYCTSLACTHVSTLFFFSFFWVDELGLGFRKAFIYLSGHLSSFVHRGETSNQES